MKLERNPERAYRQGLKAGRRDGMYDGFAAFALAAMIAGYNVDGEYFVNDEQYVKFFREWERELNRIFAEECGNDPEVLLAKAEELREKYGLAPLLDGDTP